jgi:hypothetical protein
MLDSLKDFMIAYIITNVLSIVLIIICIKWQKTGKYLFAVIFLLAGIFNFYNVSTNSGSYMEFGKLTPVWFYRDFIYGDFKVHEMIYIIIISVLQLFISVCLFTESPLLGAGLKGGIIFFILISPLGLGSAFPASLFLAIAMYILYSKRLKRMRDEMQSRIL